MEQIEYLGAIRRRWRVVVIAVFISLAAGWATIKYGNVGPKPSYSATALLVSSGASKEPGPNNLTTIAAIAKAGEIPRRVAVATNYTGDPRELAALISVSPNEESGIISITAEAKTPQRAETLANAFAAELQRFLEERKGTSKTGEAESVAKSLAQLTSEMADLDSRISAAKGSDQEDVLKQERAAKAKIYGSLYQRSQELALGIEKSGGVSLQQIEPAKGEKATQLVGLQSLQSQLAVAGIIGLLGGIAVVLLLERFETRIRTKAAAERHFGYPVLTQIPRLGRRQGRTSVVTRSRGGPAADAFRLLAAEIGSLLTLPSDGEARGNGRSTGRVGTVLVTSGGQNEGKTTVAANLAVGFAELGNRVVVFSCDFNNPRIDRMFGIRSSYGLGDALQNGPSLDGRAVLDGCIVPTRINNLSLVPSGSRPSRPAEALNSEAMRRALNEASQVADVIVLDTPPALVSDTAQLLHEVSGVVTVARAGKTTTHLAENVGELLKRLQARVFGVVLNGAKGVALPQRSKQRRPTRKASRPSARRSSRRRQRVETS